MSSATVFLPLRFPWRVSTAKLREAVAAALSARLRQLHDLGFSNWAYLPPKEAAAAREEPRADYMRSGHAKRLLEQVVQASGVLVV